MSDEKFRNQYRIQSARATWHDYSGGAYFITVCTKKREHFFGEIVCNDVTADGENTIILSPIGQFLHENLQNATDHYPYAEIPLFVVMPNHWHAVVFIDGDKTPYHR
jgi:REP element-mobilizing transposase RayT